MKPNNLGAAFALIGDFKRGQFQPGAPISDEQMEVRTVVAVELDHGDPGREEILQEAPGGVVEDALGRFNDRITRVEVHLTDENGIQKSGDSDKRCVMEARLAGMQPITVSAEGSSLEQALDGAANKLEKTLKRTLGRLDDPKGRTSYAGDPS